MKKRILVVDDEQDFTCLIKAALESQGYYDVREENDATHAVAAGREFDPDLVLLDIMMPAMDGSELASRLKGDRVLWEVPIIFLTSLVSNADAPTGECTSGGQTFLPKDIPLDQLMRCIDAKLSVDRPLAV